MALQIMSVNTGSLVTSAADTLSGTVLNLIRPVTFRSTYTVPKTCKLRMLSKFHMALVRQQEFTLNLGKQNRDIFWLVSHPKTAKEAERSSGPVTIIKLHL